MDPETYEKGREIRTAVLGEAYVARATATPTNSRAAAGSGHRVLLGGGVGT